jgi:hypothetical protein
LTYFTAEIHEIGNERRLEAHLGTERLRRSA